MTEVEYLSIRGRNFWLELSFLIGTILLRPILFTLTGYLIISAYAWQNVTGREMTTPFQQLKWQQISFHDARLRSSKFHHS